MSGAASKKPSDIRVTRLARAPQVAAGDPARSAWVTANAGSGKTFVLSERVVRLLLQGVDPARILCLTYTRTAAANMRDAVFERLSRLATASETELAAAIEKLTALEPEAATGSLPPLPAEKALAARRLFARALETPGGLRIQTIHAFCESVLRRFPLEANIAGHFDILQGAAETALRQNVRNAMLAGMAADEAGLADAFAAVMEEGGEAALDALLEFAAKNRVPLVRFIRDAKGAGDFAALFASFGFGPDDTVERLADAVWPAAELDEARLRHWLAISAKTVAMQEKVSSMLAAFCLPDAVARADATAEAFLTGKGMPFSRFTTKAVDPVDPDAQPRYERAAEHIQKAHAKLADVRLLTRTVHALRLCDAFITRMEDRKRASGLLDFADMIEAARRLLSRKGVAPWVRYKLDAGIDHILLDEAQDTSPAQWAVLDPLVQDLFSGIGDMGRRRSLFVVGDPKQSIYSFQGARPESFDTQKRRYGAGAAAATPAGVDLQPISFQSSFRTATAILDAVDAVFAKGAPAREGLTEGDDGTAHTSLRLAAPGCVDVWETIIGEAPPEPEEWHGRTENKASPEVRLAQRITTDIAGRIASGAARPGDILVLVRKRTGIVPALTRLLKKAGIPVAGADRLKLLSAIAVRDLMAIARVALQPADDLSLAALMKSPVFGLTDDDLLRVAPGRKPGVTLLDALAASTEPAFHAIVDAVSAWTTLSRSTSVPGFFSRLLGEHGLRRLFLARLGPETEDVLDEFLRAAEDSARSGVRSLDAFLESLSADPPEIKREMEQGSDQVRIMTIHAAKGLEAPHVYLIDGTTDAMPSGRPPQLQELAPPFPPLRGGEAWLWTGGLSQTPLKHGHLLAEAKAVAKRRAEDEYRRLLYVGMTRAKDRLTIAVHATAKAKPDGKWATWVRAALGGLAGARQIEQDGFKLLRFEMRPPAAVSPEEAARADGAPAAPLPFAFPSLPPEERLPRPLAPSIASLAIEPDAEMRPAMPLSSPVSTAQAAGSVSSSGVMARGTLVHRLLQRLPDLPPETRPAAARRMARVLAAQHGGDVPDGDLQGEAWLEGIIAEALRVLDAPDFASLFSGSSRSEVAIMGRVSHHGVLRSVTGVIDRLVESNEAVTVIDFKTGRTPQSLSGVPEAHLAQIALYALLLRGVFPGKPVAAVLAYTAPPRRFDLPQAALDAACARLGITPPLRSGS